jgi:lauroyl/myristoyl acyltransferase
MARFFRLWPDRLCEPRWKKRCTFYGNERLEAALSSNRPVVLATVHYGNLTEIYHWLRANGHAIAFLQNIDLTWETSYRDYLETLADRANRMENVPRRFSSEQTWEANDFLKGGRRLLGVAMDMPARHPKAVLARGEAIRVSFLTGGLRLAAIANAIVLPCVIRATWWLRSEIYFGEPVPDEMVISRNQHVQALEHILHEVSPWIVANPEQCAPHLLRAMVLEGDTISKDGL